MAQSSLVSMNGLDEDTEKLLTAILTCMDETDFAHYAALVREHNVRPTFICRKGVLFPVGLETVAHWDALRDDLERIPHYFTAAHDAGLRQEEARQILFVTVGVSEPKPLLERFFKGTQSSDKIEGLTKIFDLCSQQQTPITSDDIDAYKDCFLSSSFGEDETKHILNLLYAGTACGFSLKQSFAIAAVVHQKVSDVRQGDHCPHEEGDPYYAIEDQLLALSTHNVNSGLVYDVIRAGMETGYLFDWPYGKSFSEAVYAWGRTGLPQEDVFLMLLDAAEKGEETLAQAIDTLTVNNSKNFKTCVDQPVETYFPRIDTQQIRDGILPYCVARTWKAGLADLRQMAAKGWTAGNYFFVPEKELWYSLGGSTHFGIHEAYPYDASRLGQAPLYVTVHAKNNRGVLTETWTLTRYPEEHEDYVKSFFKRFYTFLPYRSDYNNLARMAQTAPKDKPLKGALVTATHVTEVTCPPYTKAIESVCDDLDSLVDSVLLTFDVEPFWCDDEIGYHNEDLIEDLFARLTKDLPEGFALRTHPFEAPPGRRKYFLSSKGPSLG